MPLFATLPPADLLPLAMSAEVRTFVRGQCIMRQGEPGDDVYVVIEGNVQVSAAVERGGIVTQATLSTLGPGDTLGELSLLDGLPRSATCLVADDTRCLRLGRSDFLEALQRHWSLSKTLLAALAQRLRQADERLIESARDPLTGLYSRGALADLYDRQVARLRRSGADRRQPRAARTARETRGVAMLYVDVDQFKEINDRHGHSTGDAVLCAMATRLTELTRRTDVVARHGGDEFVILLSEADAATAARIAERIRRSLQQQPPGPVLFTASIGVAVADPQQPQDLAGLVSVADAAMYLDKTRRAAS